MSGLRETAYAKINLALHVRARLADGYHRIETIFAFCEHGDVLEADPSDALGLTITGPFAAGLSAGEDNLVMRAARALAAEAGCAPRAALRLDKRLPVASGIGGGSADAAAALRLLTRLWGVDVPEARLLAVAAALGADVPACVASVGARGEGRGDALTPFDDATLARNHVLLVNPGVTLSTAEVFAGWDGVDRGALADRAADGRNDLEPSALTLAPTVGTVLQLLNTQPGASLVRMSGSGATCFALFADAADRDAADARVAAARPGWWRLRSRLR